MSTSPLRPRALVKRVSRGLRSRVLRWAGCPGGYRFLPAPSIRTQSFSFGFGGREFTVEAGYDTPLYETIAEIVDFDCYRLRDLGSDTLAGTAMVDIGANVGVTSLCLSQLCGTGRVVSFEPIPKNRAWLQKNLERNRLANVEVRASAVTAAAGRSSFWVPDHESVGGRLERPEGGQGQQIEVETTGLEGALAGLGTIGLLKVDCEGGEYDIIEQLAPLASRVRNITMEVHYRGETRNLGWLSERLRQLGYQLRFKPDPFGREQLHHVLASR